MTNKTKLCVGVGALLAGAGVTNAGVNFTGPITDIDGRGGAQYTGPGSSDVRMRFKPMSAGQTDLNISNIYIHDVLNQKGIDIGANINGNNAMVFQNITVSHYDNARDVRTIGGLHIDGIRISGAGNRVAPKTNVNLIDVSIHDGSALPINIQDGNYGTIYLKDVEVFGNQLNQLQIAAINSGHVDKVIIEDSPNLHVALMGKVGAIGQVIIRNSPGASVSDVMVYGQRSGASITSDNSPSGSHTGSGTGSGTTGGSTGGSTGPTAPTTPTTPVKLPPAPAQVIGDGSSILGGVHVLGTANAGAELDGLHVTGAGEISALGGSASDDTTALIGSSVSSSDAGSFAGVSTQTTALPEPGAFGVLGIASVFATRRRRQSKRAA